MPRKKPDKLEAKQEALNAWAEMPKSKPSKEALPPAGGGVEYLFGWFLGAFEAIREHKLLSIGVVVVVVAVLLLLRVWQ